MKGKGFFDFAVQSLRRAYARHSTGTCARQLAQSASELAIFGAILMFIIGIIVSSGFRASHTMNVRLKALRYAMSESRTTSQGGATARNTASITLMEDRLSVAAGQKLGTRDRIPLIGGASVTFSKQLFQPVDFDETANLPIADVIVNGQRFPFSIASFMTIDLVPSGSNPIPDCSTNPREGRCWEPRCLSVSGSDVGCVVMYKIVGNYDNSTDWDDACAECFDLDFDGVPDVPIADRDKFNWQWVKVAGISDGSSGSINTGVMGNGVRGINVSGDVNVNVDADGDLKEEKVFNINTNVNGVITSLGVRDDQEGDLDFTRDDRDDILRLAKGLPPLAELGIGDDIQMFSFTRDGTLLRVEEGKLFDAATGQFVRETLRQEQVDIIQRGFRFSRDTGRFCNGGAPQATVSGLENPIEVCCNASASVCSNGATGCFHADAVQLTCMDTAALIIFIRSRIEDLRGRRWITRFDPQG